MLAVVAPAHLDAGDLGQRIGTVGGLQRTGEQVALAHRLLRQPGVDAARTEEEQSLHTGQIRCVQGVGLDRQVVVDEVRREAVVGHDAAHLGGSQKDEFRPLELEKGLRRALVGQIEFGARAQDQVGVSGRLQAAHDRAAYQAAMAGNEDPGVWPHRGAHS